MTAARLERSLSELAARRRTALVAYLTIGDPSVEDSLACARAALDAGADALELGVPFSDPTADGPVIAAAAHRAIRAGGSLRAALRVAEALRRDTEAPLVLFTYLNPVVAFGERELPAAAVRAGVDAALIVDLPPEEGAPLREAARAAELAVVPLIAPTTGEERMRSILAGARGFAYYVSVTGVTGAGAAPLADASRAAAALQARSGVPVVVGFGVDSPEKARLAASAGAAGVVVGTALVRRIAEGATTDARCAAVAELIGALRRGLDA